MNNRNWIAPLCGAIFVVLAVIAFAMTGDGQDPSKQSADQIVAYYQDHADANEFAAFILGWAGVFLLFFAGWLRQLLRNAEGEGSWLSNVAFGALVALIAAIGVGATIHLALVDYVDDVDPAVTATINTIDYDFFIPFAMGMAAFLISTGIVVTRTAVMPKWLGWIAIILGVVAVTPAGFVGFLGGLAWILVVGLLGAARTRRPATA
jgi:hypothetical protein